MLVLFETAAGYALFKVLKQKKVADAETMWEHFQTPEKAGKVLQLVHFEKFKAMQDALQAITATVEGELNKTLSKMIKKRIKKEVDEVLAVADSKLGSAIQSEFDINCIYNPTILELMRCIRTQADSLISGEQHEMARMSTGLAHSLSRYKLKFNPDKVDAMITSGVSTLEDLDKELNNFCMRLREFYGWHFPELGKIIQDNIVYAKVVKLIGDKQEAVDRAMEDVVESSVEKEIKEAAEISMGSEIAPSDLQTIALLCDRILELSEAREVLSNYIQSRMKALAPNTSIIVGEMIGAKLIAHAGTLTNLAKMASSTVQILGAEKALFRALKKKQDTPKYGILYHASMVGSTSVKNKGKMSRMVAAKAAIAARYDAFGEGDSQEMGLKQYSKLTSRLRSLDEGQSRRISGTAKAQAKHDKYVNKSSVVVTPEVAASIPRVPRQEVNESGDAPKPKKRKKQDKEQEEEEEVEEETPKKKKKKKHRQEVEEGEDTPKSKKHKAQDEAEDEDELPTKKKHKRKSQPEEAVGDVNGEVESKKKKKKKKKEAQEVESD